MTNQKYPKTNDFTFKDHMYEFIKTNLVFGLIKGAGVPMSQPPQVMLRRIQSQLRGENPKFLSTREAYRAIAQEKSRWSFFNGTTSAISKEMFKNIVYKGALIKGAPDLAKWALPRELSGQMSPTVYHLMQSIVAGQIAGFADATLGGPFDRLSTYRAASNESNVKSAFWKGAFEQKSIPGFMKYFYKGYVPSVLKNCVGYSTYFVCKSPIENWVKSLYSIDKNMPLPLQCMLMSAVLTGSSVALTSSIFDVLKTQYQMPEAIKEGLWKAMQNNYKLHGHKWAIAGFELKFLMITWGWFLNTMALYLLDGLEKHPALEDQLPRPKM